MEFRRILDVLCLWVLQNKFWAQFHDFCIHKAVCRGIQTYLGSLLHASFTEVLGAIPRFLRPKMKLFSVKFRRILEGFCLRVLQKTLKAQFHDLCVQKQSCLLWNTEGFWKLSAFKVCLWALCHDLCVQKRSFFLWNLDVFWKFSPCKLCEKVLGAIPRFLRPKTKLFAMKFRRILEVLCLRCLWVIPFEIFKIFCNHMSWNLFICAFS